MSSFIYTNAYICAYDTFKIPKSAFSPPASCLIISSHLSRSFLCIMEKGFVYQMIMLVDPQFHSHLHFCPV